MAAGAPGESLLEGCTALPGSSGGGRAIRIAELHAAGLGDRERLPGAPGDRLALLLGHECHDPHREIIGFRHVAGEQAHATVPECQQEGGIARESVKLAMTRVAPVTLAR